MSTEYPAGNGCEQVKDLLSAYLDDQVNIDERALVEEHLAACIACSEELRGLRLTAEMLGTLPAAPVPCSFAIPVPESKPSGIMLWFGRMKVGASIAAVMLVALLTFDFIGQGAYTNMDSVPPAQTVTSREEAPVAGVPDAFSDNGEKSTLDRSSELTPTVFGAAPTGEKNPGRGSGQDSRTGTAGGLPADAYVEDPGDPQGRISSTTREPNEAAPAEEQISTVQRPVEEPALLRVGEGFLSLVIIVTLTGLVIIRRRDVKSQRR